MRPNTRKRRGPVQAPDLDSSAADQAARTTATVHAESSDQDHCAVACSPSACGYPSCVGRSVEFRVTALAEGSPVGTRNMPSLDEAQRFLARRASPRGGVHWVVERRHVGRWEIVG